MATMRGVHFCTGSGIVMPLRGFGRIVDVHMFYVNIPACPVVCLLGGKTEEMQPTSLQCAI